MKFLDDFFAPCDCGCTVLRLQHSPREDAPIWIDVLIEDTRHAWSYRLKSALAMLCGRRYWSYCLSWNLDTIRALRDHLTDALEAER